PQAARASSFQEQYEPRIYLRGEVQTRRHNWHDFFQVLVWSAFPDTKKTINALHYVSAQQRLNEKGHTNRSPTENMLALFDECGAVLLSSDPALLKMIRNFEWHELFWLNREKLLRSLRCIVFGHAMYEKALNPY
ncbi:MAG: DUF3025 domain-containing protein, partial [Gammaproteobacteria bacterium]|nr:DUF3025 domain-containing protein [Gammaproteobacteria bacterium]NIR93223.1 DUF3025 domain-containing protein [Gammaproteobacteria bacterium]